MTLPLRSAAFIVFISLWLPVLLMADPASGKQRERSEITSASNKDAPWGSAENLEITYKPQKVLYEVSTSSIKTLRGVLNRVSFLNNLYGADPFEASIVVVLHGNEIPFFAIKNYDKYKELMDRAQSLTENGPIEFRMCRVAAKGHGFEPSGINGFVKMVPMADAEIIRLQNQEGYAYMR